MRFWDSSALVPLMVEQPASSRLQALAAKETQPMVWWASAIECASAVARHEREGTLDEDSATRAFGYLQKLAAGWNEVEASAPIREAAIRLLRVHPLRAADALQLAAAYVASGKQPASLEFVTLDDRLATAARKEGFSVITV